MKSIIGIILIVLAAALAIDGIRKLDESETNVRFLGIRINAEDSGAKNTAVIQIGLAVIALIGGIYVIKNSKN
jgi:hypothetical protein